MSIKGVLRKRSSSFDNWRGGFQVQGDRIGQVCLKCNEENLIWREEQHALLGWNEKRKRWEKHICPWNKRVPQTKNESGIVCKKCGLEGLHWEKPLEKVVSGKPKFYLATVDGKPHVCPKYLSKIQGMIASRKSKGESNE